MKKLVTLIAVLLLSVVTFAQKASVKKGEIHSDGNTIAKIEKDGCGLFSGTCTYYIRSLNDETLITVIAIKMKDPLEPGIISYLHFSFSGFDKAAEISNPAIFNTRPKDVAKSIVKARLILNGKLDKEAVNNFIKAHGTRFSEMQHAFQPKVIILQD